jgi:hypothetical protein
MPVHNASATSPQSRPSSKTLAGMSDCASHEAVALHAGIQARRAPNNSDNYLGSRVSAARGTSTTLVASAECNANGPELTLTGLLFVVMRIRQSGHLFISQHSRPANVATEDFSVVCCTGPNDGNLHDAATEQRASGGNRSAACSTSDRTAPLWI